MDIENLLKEIKVINEALNIACQLIANATYTYTPSDKWKENLLMEARERLDDM